MLRIFLVIDAGGECQQYNDKKPILDNINKILLSFAKSFNKHTSTQQKNA
jgi:hypothetical protein